MSINQNDIDLIRQAIGSHVGGWSEERKDQDRDKVHHAYESIQRLQSLLEGDDWVDSWPDKVIEAAKGVERTCDECAVEMFHAGPYYPTHCDNCEGNDEAVA